MIQTKPLMVDITGGVEYGFEVGEGQESYYIVFQIRHLSRSRYGDLIADLDVFALGNMDAMSAVTGVKFNLSSTQARNGMVKYLQGQWRSTLQFAPEWSEMVDEVCRQAIRNYRAGEAPTDICPSGDADLSVKYLLHPLIYDHLPTVIFGEGASLKSYMAMLCAITVQLPYHDNTLGLVPTGNSVKCLWLDYEGEKDTFYQQLGEVQRAFGLSGVSMKHLAMETPLCEQVEQLQHRIKEDNIGLVVVDSIAPAVGINPNEPENALRYTTALRQLGVASLAIGHTSKNPENKNSRTIFGSVFFYNLARMVWECRAQKEPGSNEALISLKCVKANRSQLHLPLGYRFTWDSSDTLESIVKTDLRDTGLSMALPLRFRILDLLKDEGRLMTILEIAEALDAPQGSVKKTLYDLKGQGAVYKIGSQWGLATNQKEG